MRILGQRETFAYFRQLLAMTDEEYHQHAARVDKTLTDMAHQGVDTRTMHGHVSANGRSHWNADRRRQHQEIVRHFYDQMVAQNTPQEGKAMILGGLGGAGKGHALRSGHIPLDAHNYFTINPDDVKEEMARRGMIPQADHLSPMESTGLAHEEASDIAKRVATLGYRQKRNLIWDITMSGDNSVAGRINTMRKHGYNQIDGVFVDADPSIARNRVRNRHRTDEEPYRDAGQGLGGRYVPEELTQKNFPTPGSGKRSANAEVFDRLRPQFDNTLNLDATGPTPQMADHHGTRWEGHAPTWQPPKPPTPQNPQVIGRRLPTGYILRSGKKR